MTPAGAINVWTCDTCGAQLVAIHAHEGVTPMLLACREEDCGGTGVSAGYPPGPPPPAILAKLAWEWRVATNTQMKRWRREKSGMYEHCLMGGLVLVKRGSDG